MIDEEVVAKTCGCTPREVYEQLKALTHMRVLNYIPKKCASYITYLTRRLEGRSLLFPPIVYAQRKEQYIKRIQSVIDYASRTDVCRSVYLLAYFGENDVAPCGGCDVCLEQRRQDLDPIVVAELLLQRLSVGQSYPVSELSDVCKHISATVKKQAWTYLVEQEFIACKDGMIHRMK